MRPHSFVIPALVLLNPVVASATLTLQESFSYTPGANLVGQNGGTGGAAAWTAGATGGSPTISAANSSLAYPASSPLVSQGAHLAGPTGATSVSATRNLTTTMSLLTSSMGYYSSSLMSISETGQLITIGFSDTVPNVRWSYGINASGNFFATVSPPPISTTQTATTSFTAQLNTTYLVVTYIRTNTGPSGNDEVFIKVYAPGDTIVAPASDAAWDATANGNSGVVLSRLRVDMTNTATGGAMGLDEIRIGSTFLDVTGVIPEPGSIALSGLAFTLGLVRRKRR